MRRYVGRAIFFGVGGVVCCLSGYMRLGFDRLYVQIVAGLLVCAWLFVETLWLRKECLTASRCIREGETPCWKCGYCVAGLPAGGSCPECGLHRAFEESSLAWERFFPPAVPAGRPSHKTLEGSRRFRPAQPWNKRRLRIRPLIYFGWMVCYALLLLSVCLVFFARNLPLVSSYAMVAAFLGFAPIAMVRASEARMARAGWRDARLGRPACWCCGFCLESVSDGASCPRCGLENATEESTLAWEHFLRKTTRGISRPGIVRPIARKC